MKSALQILIGSILGSVAYVSVTYNLLPQDSGAYTSYLDALLITAGISLVVALVFWGFFELFKVRSENVVIVVGSSFLVQLLSWFSSLLFPNFGILTFAVAVLVLAALSNFILSQFKAGPNSTF